MVTVTARSEIKPLGENYHLSFHTLIFLALLLCKIPVPLLHRTMNRKEEIYAPLKASRGEIVECHRREERHGELLARHGVLSSHFPLLPSPQPNPLLPPGSSSLSLFLLVFIIPAILCHPPPSSH